MRPPARVLGRPAQDAGQPLALVVIPHREDELLVLGRPHAASTLLPRRDSSSPLASVLWADSMPADAAIDALLEGLNPPQRDAVTHGEGPLLILAGAGSGKTRVLTHRIAYLMRTGQARPSEILAITFTNKAAAEMRERVELLVGRATRAMWVMTFHSACARMLRSDADKLGYTRQFTIYDSADQRRLIKQLPRRPGHRRQALHARARCSPRSPTPRTSCAPSRTTPSSSAPSSSRPSPTSTSSTSASCTAPTRWTSTTCSSAPSTCSSSSRRSATATPNSFRWVMVDEYQDTNHVQYRWLQLLTSEHRNLAVVGDDAQSIYGFRGADIKNILNFQDDYPDAHVVKLEQNYRSTQTILDAANGVIANNRGQMAKHLWTDVGEGDPVRVREMADEHAEARWVTAEIERLVDEGVVALGDRGLLPDERAVAGARGHAGARADRLPGDRRHEVLRAGGDQGRGQLPHVPGQPAGRDGVHADRELAAARARADVDVARARRTPRRRGSRSGRPRPATSPAWRPRRASRSSASCRRWSACSERVESGAPVAQVLAGAAGGDRLQGGARGRADDRGPGPAREPRGARAR